MQNTNIKSGDSPEEFVIRPPPTKKTSTYDCVIDLNNNNLETTSPSRRPINYKVFYKQRSSSFDIESPTIKMNASKAATKSDSLSLKPQTLSTTGSTQSKSSYKKKGAQKRTKQPQERYGASPAFLKPDGQLPPEALKHLGNVLLFNKAILNQNHYSFFYYENQYQTLLHQVKNPDPNVQDPAPQVRNESKVLKLLPDILYSQSCDGEITIEWDEQTKRLQLLTMVDITGVQLPDPDFMPRLIQGLQKADHPNLLNLKGSTLMLDSVQTIAFRSEAPDHISTWKQFCKTNMSLFHTLSLFRQLASAVGHLNEHGIIHRDVHPTRLHMHNGLLKFNPVGLPYNFKKLMKNPHYSGHVSYSAPELINETHSFAANSDTWSLGCCLYYLATKCDPFQARSIEETKQNIINLRLDTTNQLKYHNQILSKLVYQCLERNPLKRMTSAQIVQFQDDLELTTFGLPLSQLHFSLQVRQNQLSDSLASRVAKDRAQRDYQGQSLDLRNNPWFFSKEYGQQPLTDDEDFYFLVETKVGSSKQLRMKLLAEAKLLQDCQQKLESANPYKGKGKKSVKEKARFDKKNMHNQKTQQDKEEAAPSKITPI